MIAPEVQKELQRLELALASRDPTGIDGGLTSLIADDFLEFGKSGRVRPRPSARSWKARPWNPWRSRTSMLLSLRKVSSW